jgi:hypothetical protein
MSERELDGDRLSAAPSISVLSESIGTEQSLPRRSRKYAHGELGRVFFSGRPRVSLPAPPCGAYRRPLSSTNSMTASGYPSA